jgi:hypothetical protein
LTGIQEELFLLNFKVKEECAMKGKPQFNHEGYRDMVPYKAIKNMEREKKRRPVVRRTERRERRG